MTRARKHQPKRDIAKEIDVLRIEVKRLRNEVRILDKKIPLPPFTGITWG